MATPTTAIAIGRIDPQPVSVGAGGVLQLYVAPTDADRNQSGHTINLVSSDTSVARVVRASVKGHAPVTIAGISAGTATITATAADNAAITATLVVTVT